MIFSFHLVQNFTRIIDEVFFRRQECIISLLLHHCQRSWQPESTLKLMVFMLRWLCLSGYIRATLYSCAVRPWGKRCILQLYEDMDSRPVLLSNHCLHLHHILISQKQKSYLSSILNVIIQCVPQGWWYPILSP